MQISKKSLKGLITGIISLSIMMLVFFGLTSTAYAAPGTLGTKEPYIYFSYYNELGEEVDGDNLAAGTYNVKVNISGINEFSTLQLTATYTDAVAISPDGVSLLSDSVLNTSSMGYVLDNGNLVFGFVSTNEGCSTIDENGTLVASFNATFANACDAADVISVSTNPNLTFVQADYADGYDDEYALVSSFDGYTGTLYPMTCDVSPSSGYSVSGEIVIATASSGKTDNTPVNGTFTVDVYSSADMIEAAKVATVQSNRLNDKNVFTIDSLKPGTYYATITSEFAIAREVVITVTDHAIANAVIPMIVCDFNKDTYITSVDALDVYMNSGSNDLNYDLNGDGFITSVDALTVYACSGFNGYSTITIQ